MTTDERQLTVKDLMSEFRQLVVGLQEEQEALKRRLQSLDMSESSGGGSISRRRTEPSSSTSSSNTFPTASAATSTNVDSNGSALNTHSTSNSGNTSPSDQTAATSNTTKPPSYKTVVPHPPARTRRRAVSSNPSGTATTTTTTTTSNSTRAYFLTQTLPTRMSLASGAMARGGLIVFEGLDRVGKSTLAKKLVEHLERTSRSVSYIRFPDRTTSIGKLINEYLTCSSTKQINNRALHLLFSANRWEVSQTIKERLKMGTTVVVDRYSYSGIAYSSASNDVSLDWCSEPENGLPQPDLVIYLELAREAQYKRQGFGDEKFETREYQETVRVQYEKLIGRSREKWLRIDVKDKSPDQLLSEIVLPVRQCLESCCNEDIGKLKI